MSAKYHLQKLNVQWSALILDEEQTAVEKFRYGLLLANNMYILITLMRLYASGIEATYTGTRPEI